VIKLSKIIKININKSKFMEGRRMKKQINIEGMSCGHCVKHVEEALKEINGVTSVSVDLENKNAVIELSTEVADSQLKNAIEEAGYDVVSIEKV
jgi:copper ion binding protein